VALEKKQAMKVETTFSDSDFQSAMAKMTGAAVKYHKGAPGAVGLNAFECVTMPPHVVKEQLKMVFGIKVTPQELGALLSYFGDVKELNCQHFLMKFFRLGYEERYRIESVWKEDKKIKAQQRKQQEEDKLYESVNRGKVDIDHNFLESDFDSALEKIITLCHRFEPRQLGSAGMKMFQSNVLSPGEFKETLKRTFSVLVTPRELGALVSYFDTSMSGVVSTQAFLSAFVQIRVTIEPWKGKPGNK
jgi:hypothetical protein